MSDPAYIEPILHALVVCFIKQGKVGIYMYMHMRACVYIYIEYDCDCVNHTSHHIRGQTVVGGFWAGRVRITKNRTPL